MSASSLKRLVDTLEPKAVAISEREEHQPILVTPSDIVLVRDYSGVRGGISEALHALCAKLRPREACFIHEAWAMRPDAPEWVKQSVLGPEGEGVGGVAVADLKRAYRDELLVLHAEDDQGNWRMHGWLIKERRRGGVVRSSELAGGADDETLGGAMRGFVPRMQASV